jgi:hypothetical protein
MLAHLHGGRCDSARRRQPTHRSRCHCSSVTTRATRPLRPQNGHVASAPSRRRAAACRPGHANTTHSTAPSSGSGPPRASSKASAPAFGVTCNSVPPSSVRRSLPPFCSSRRRLRRRCSSSWCCRRPSAELRYVLCASRSRSRCATTEHGSQYTRPGWQLRQHSNGCRHRLHGRRHRTWISCATRMSSGRKLDTADRSGDSHPETRRCHPLGGPGPFRVARLVCSWVSLYCGSRTGKFSASPAHTLTHLPVPTHPRPPLLRCAPTDTTCCIADGIGCASYRSVRARMLFGTEWSLRLGRKVDKSRSRV